MQSRSACNFFEKSSPMAPVSPAWGRLKLNRLTCQRIDSIRTRVRPTRQPCREPTIAANPPSRPPTQHLSLFPSARLSPLENTRSFIFQPRSPAQTPQGHQLTAHRPSSGTGSPRRRMSPSFREELDRASPTTRSEPTPTVSPLDRLHAGASRPRSWRALLNRVRPNVSARGTSARNRASLKPAAVRAGERSGLSASAERPGGTRPAQRCAEPVPRARIAPPPDNGTE